MLNSQNFLSDFSLQESLYNENKFLRKNEFMSNFSLVNNIFLSTSNRTSDLLLKNLLILQSFEDLKFNWNDNNAKAFDRKLIKKVSEILYQLKYQPEIFPTASDSIQLEFDNNGNYLEFEISNHIFISMFSLKNGIKRFRKIFKFQISNKLLEFYE